MYCTSSTHIFYTEYSIALTVELHRLDTDAVRSYVLLSENERRNGTDEHAVLSTDGISRSASHVLTLYSEVQTK
jgi:hypothetical protein